MSFVQWRVGMIPISSAFCRIRSASPLSTSRTGRLWPGCSRTPAAALAPGGRLVPSFRDLSRPPTGPDRFIPVRSDSETVTTCFLEDAGEHVVEHDLIHERQPDDTWSQQVSSYAKLKIASAEVV
jgi:hypothetical protein